MALSKSAIDLIYEDVLFRHATDAEQTAFATLSANGASDLQIEDDITKLPEVTDLIDPLIRLYQGAFDRVPDSAGLAFWANALRSGSLSLSDIDGAFTHSTEFLALYGTNTVTPALIIAFYHNVLGRDPDAAGLAFWVNSGLDAAAILNGFTQSAEFVASSQASVDFFKVELAEGQHPTGPLEPPPPPPPPPSTTQFFTATVGETLVGGAVNTVFEGTVDTVIAGNNTLSNVVDVAQGNAAFHNTEYIIIDNSSGTNINPSSTGVQEMKITNIDASGMGGLTNVNAQFMHDVTTVTSFGSSKGMNIFNLQNFISTINVEQSDAPGGLNFNVKMIDSTPVGGTQTINLINAGTGMGGTLLMDETTSGKDVVGEFDINSLGMNKLTIDGTSIATTFRVADTGSGADVTTIVSADDTEALTLIDTTGVAGTVSMWGFEAEGGNTLQVNEGGGTNTFGIAVEDNATLNVSGGNGTDTLFAHFQQEDAPTPNGGTIIVNEGDGNDRLDVDNDNAGNFQTVKATYGNGNDTLNVESGNNATVTLQAGNGTDNVTVSVAELSTVKVTLGNGADNTASGGGVVINDGEQSNVTVIGGNGGDTVTINTLDSDTLSSVGEIDGHQTYTVTLGTGANTLTITPGGSDPTFSASDDGHIGTPGDDSFHNPNGEPDSVIASNQVIKVNMGVGGTATQTVNIETGVNSQVNVTTGDGANSITINADNDLWTHSTVNDTVSFAGEGGSQVTVNTGNGNNTVNVNVDATGFDFVTQKWLDAGSNVQITTGNGNNDVIVTLGTAGQGNTANVQTGSGNDRVQFDVADINAGIVANGGAGTNTIALVSASAGATAGALAGLSNFEILEVTNVLANSVDLDNYEPQNAINHVVLDQGFTGSGLGSHTISGAEQNFQLDLLAGSPGQNLNILVDNAAINTNDAVGIKLDANHAGTTDFGTVTLNPVLVNVVENVSIDSTSTNPMATQNNLHLGDNGIQTLNIVHDAGGDVTLDLDGSTTNFGGSALTSVQASTFTGGIIWDDAGNGLGNDNNNITFNAPVSGNDSLRFGNGNDTVTLGNGSNTVTFGTGSDSYTAASGNNHVTFNTSAGHIDTVTLGTGSNLVDFNGTGGTGSTVSFQAHALGDTVEFSHQANSTFSLPDTLTGIQASTDTLLFDKGIFGGNTTFDFVTVASQVGVIAAAASDSAAHETFIYDLSSGHLYVDVNHDHSLTAAADMEVGLTGIPHITAANIHVA